LPSSPAAEPAAATPLSGLVAWVQTAGNLMLAFVILPQPLSADQGKTIFHLGDVLRFLDRMASDQGSGQKLDKPADPPA
jgi:hypothetical protein